MQCVPPTWDLLWKDHKDVSQRTVENVRVVRPERKRFVLLAALRHIDPI